MITSYRTEIDDSYRTIVVKEKEIEYDETLYCNPVKIVEMMNSAFKLDRLAEEHFYLLCMDTKCRIIGVFELSHGTANWSIASTRDVFMKALMVGSVAIVLVHNHPSGDSTPSVEDIQVYKRNQEASKLMNIEFIDFIIVGRNQYTSFNENKL